MSTLSDLQTEITALIAADAALAAARLSAVAQNRKDVVGEVNERVAKIGICAIVITPKARADGAAACGPLVSIEAVVRVAEKPVVNRARAGHVTALDAAERIAVLLHAVTPASATAPLMFSNLEEEPGADELVYTVTFTSKTALT
jgi:hypothetical protein